MSGTALERGSSMLELLLALCVLAIIATAAYPTVVRARTTSIETAAVAAVRTILDAQAVYAAACGNGYFAPSIQSLTRSADATGDAFLGSEFTGDVVDRWGYRIRFTPGTPVPVAPRSCNGVDAGEAVRDYFVSADPIEMTGPAADGRHYAANPSGVVFESRKRVRLTLTGTPPPPARPLR